MRWWRRRLWTVEELVSTGLLVGLIALIGFVARPMGDAKAVEGETKPVQGAALPRASDPKPGEILFPVPGVSPKAMADSFHDARGARTHHAVDILAPRNSEVVAVADGTIARMMTSAAGGIAVYQWNADATLVYYYAHLEGYAKGLAEGQTVTRGQVLGYVGTTGNAPANTPHLHFAISRVDKKGRWWGGAPVNPFPLWR
jgi:murein DD-endopeptidase MepM/ murein hydrolase activator NlpD